MMTPSHPRAGGLTPRLEKSKQEQRPIVGPHSRVAQGNTGVLEPHNGKLGCAAYTADWQRRHRNVETSFSPTTHPCPETPVTPEVSPDEPATARN